MPQEPVLTVKETRALLRISKATLYKLLGAGELPSFHIGRSRRIPAQAVDRYIEARLKSDAA